MLRYGDEVYIVELTELRCSQETYDLIPLVDEPGATFRERAQHCAQTFKRLEPAAHISLTFKISGNRTVHATIGIRRTLE